MKNILSFLIVFLVTLYIGEDQGQFIAGTNAEIGDHIKIKSDVRSYIAQTKGLFVTANKVLYKFSIGSDTLSFNHECWHGVDTPIYKPTTKSTKNIGYTF